MSTDHPTFADLAGTPALAAEVDRDHIPELLGEMERLRAILWARLALRINRADPKEDRLLSVEEAATKLGTKEITEGLSPAGRSDGVPISRQRPAP